MVRLSSDLPLNRNDELRPMILKPGNLGENGDQFFGEAIGKIVIGGVTTGVDQGQNGNRTGCVARFGRCGPP